MLGRIGGQFVQNEPERGGGVGRQQDGLSVEAYPVRVVGRIGAELLGLFPGQAAAENAPAASQPHRHLQWVPTPLDQGPGAVPLDATGDDAHHIHRTAAAHQRPG